jgi:hypothetical protein
VLKRITAGLALIGVALAAALVKGVIGKAMDAPGWIGLVIWFVIIGFVVVVALSDRSSPDPPEQPPIPDG